MADSLLDILARKDFSEPPEIAAIKNYIREHFNAEAEVTNRDFEIIITVASAALASTLRFRLVEIRRAAQTKKRLVLRIR